MIGLEKAIWLLSLDRGFALAIETNAKKRDMDFIAD